jgi:cysteine desulfurase
LNSLSDRIDITYIIPNQYGIIDPLLIEQAIKPNTALITIMFANNEIGSINPIKTIGEIAHRHNIPFHTDAVQIFGKIRVDMPKFNIDALSASFHKFYGPMGVGLLIIKKSFINGYGLVAQINGTQQNGYRGGTENVPGIAGSLAAMKYTFTKRDEKNNHLLTLRNLFISLLSKHYTVVNYADLPKHGDKNCICIFGPTVDKQNSYLPNTILMSIIDYKHPFCNVKFKKYLENKKIIVSIGSACNTKSDKASHVLNSLNAKDYVKRGVIRVSFGDYNTQKDVKKIIKVINDYLSSIKL